MARGAPRRPGGARTPPACARRGPRAGPAMRTYVQLDLGKRRVGSEGEAEITLDNARDLVALEHGFESWDELTAFTQAAPARGEAGEPGGIRRRARGAAHHRRVPRLGRRGPRPGRRAVGPPRGPRADDGQCARRRRRHRGRHGTRLRRLEGAYRRGPARARQPARAQAPQCEPQRDHAEPLVDALGRRRHSRARGQAESPRTPRPATRASPPSPARAPPSAAGRGITPALVAAFPPAVAVSVGG